MLKKLLVPALVMGFCGSTQAAIVTVEVTGTLWAPVSQESNIYYATGQTINAYNAAFQQTFTSALQPHAAFSFTFQYDDAAAAGDWYDVALLSGNIGPSYSDFSAYEAQLILGADSIRFDLVQRVDYTATRYQQTAVILVSDAISNRADFRAEGNTVYGYGVFGARSAHDIMFNVVDPTSTNPDQGGEEGTNPPPSNGTSIPAPGALFLLGLGLAGLGVARRRTQ